MERPPIRALTLFTWLLAFAPFSSAQQSLFTSPGQGSVGGVAGQTTKFSTEFNPAFGFAVDTFFDFRDTDSDDGFDLGLRLLELNASAYVDPEAWAYVAIVSEEGETPALEEVALNYTGLEGNGTLKAGLFFVDFGKQMQSHVEELRTFERPLVLREYLGEELGGVGVQYDHWFPLTDAAPVRFSIGAFSSLVGEGHHDEALAEPELAAPDRKDFDELSFTGRLTTMHDVGSSGLLQYGVSTRVVPEFSATFGDLEATGLDNVVYGGDLTYGWTDDTGLKTFAAGVEALVGDGTLVVEVDDPTTPTALTPIEDTVFGLVAFADYAWGQADSAGVQYSRADLPEAPSMQASELDVYYTHFMTEYRRLRFGVTFGDSDLDGDSFRAYVQLTAFFGTHAHDNQW